MVGGKDFGMDDILNGLRNSAGNKPKEEKGVRMNAKTIDGVKYVRLEDLCDLLKLNGVLPKIEAKFRKSL